MSGAVEAAPCVWADWTWNVVDRNARGAMRAMAFTVMPVSERLRFISPTGGVSSTAYPSSVVHSARDRSNPQRMSAVYRNEFSNVNGWLHTGAKPQVIRRMSEECRHRVVVVPKVSSDAPPSRRRNAPDSGRPYFDAPADP